MPQMAPMMWTSLLLFFLYTYILILTNIYFKK